ncbi:phenylalanine--tRNA ligase subunit beta [bacterium]|nr:phenylalanine--tRNA ligase subunit beta [bacterium]
MKISYKWLKKFVDVDYTPDELSEKLTLLGLEVASITYVGYKLNDVFAAKVLDVKKIKGSDHLNVCKVRIVDKVYQIVCGASNIAENQLVALAVEGADLPCGLKIKKTVIKGVESCGMICSKKELGLEGDSTGIWVLGNFFKEGAKLSSIDGIEDIIIEIELTPNRPDCLSMLGVAREVAVLTGNKLKYPQLDKLDIPIKVNDNIPIKILDSDLCENYSAYIIRGITVAPSPFWLANAVEKLGMRSINNIVDITNYVLMEMGHPLHAFDLAKIQGPEIVVRRAKKNESIKTLDDKVRELDDTVLLIADKSSALAVAGVMGGADSEVTESTTDILLEGAYFNPVNIRNTSKKLGLSSEASYRFERGTDRVGFQDALTRAAYMTAKICGASSISNLFQDEPAKYTDNIVTGNLRKIRSYLGIKIFDDEILEIFKNLDFVLKKRINDDIELQIPSYRVDISIEEDLIEEVARIYGYDKIPMANPGSDFIDPQKNKRLIYSQFTRDVLTGAGLYETITCSLVPSETAESVNCVFADKNYPALRIANPISEMQEVLQVSLLPNILDVIKLNTKSRQETIRLFEIGNIFIPLKEKNVREKNALCLAVSGNREKFFWLDSSSSWDFYSFKGFVTDYLELLGFANLSFCRSKHSLFHPGRSADIFIGKNKIGAIGQVHPSKTAEIGVNELTFAGEFDADYLSENMKINGSYCPLPKYPAIERDLAVVVDSDLLFQEINDAVNLKKPELMESYRVVSVYEGDPIAQGKKSLNLRMTYRDREKTLNDQEVDKIHDDFSQYIVLKINAELR